MTRLASSSAKIHASYDVIVIGSGYGGAIAASRLARAGQRVCVLERGREFRPGEYPNTASEVLENYQVDGPLGRVGSPLALFDMRVNDDMSVLVGCGLGGTSLINANVCLRPDERVFDDPRWPSDFRNNAAVLDEGFESARTTLGANVYPKNFSILPKLAAQAKSARAMDVPFAATPICVSFEDGPNAVGLTQRGCNNCGDCVSGCNQGAKNTVLMNYLPDAKIHGAEIFTQVDVRYLSRHPSSGKWIVHYRIIEAGREAFGDALLTVSSDVVVLCAGTLGSSEVLLRSREQGLGCSKRLGEHFSGNGDMLGFGYNCDTQINGIGWGERAASAMPNPDVGPCITGVLTIDDPNDVNASMIIEEGVVPGAIRQIFGQALPAAAKLVGVDTDIDVLDNAKEWSREVLATVSGGKYGAMRNTQTYLVMAHDSSSGVMALQGDRLRVNWPGVGNEPVFESGNERLKQATSALGGTYVQNPSWTTALGKSLVTVHPLGGCVMADAAEDGVVDAKGRVFAGTHGTEVHDGLYVSDGSVIPRSLGVNPLLTISAITEYNVSRLAQDRGWTIDRSANVDTKGITIFGEESRSRGGAGVGVEFTESMKGFMRVGAVDYQSGYEQGKLQDGAFEFTLTIVAADVDAMLADPKHRASMVGTVAAPFLSAKPLMANDGVFELFSTDESQVATKEMRYQMLLTADSGEQYMFTGFKVVRDDKGFDMWRDTTTLYVDVYRGEKIQGSAFAKGILRIEIADFAKQVTTIRAINANNLEEKLRAEVKFGAFFGGELFQTYGKIFARPSVFDPGAPPRKRRSLRLPLPSIHTFATEDEVSLRLTRYQGGSKGAVMLSPGMGTSSEAFTLDTIEESLTEQLVAAGYDVWLFDYRASSAVAASREQSTLDDIANFDYPAAVAEVLRISGADSLQIVSHCVASATFFMSTMAGKIEGVRHAVLSQFMPFIDTAPVVALKSGMHLPSLLQTFGVDTLDTEFTTKSDFGKQAFDQLLKLYPTQSGEACNSPVCRRIRFMWGEVFRHQQLNFATHQAIHELFGVGNMSLFSHLARVVREKKLVNHQGRDIYLPHTDRLNFPLTMLQGAENTLFLPTSSERWLNHLKKTNPSGSYERKVFDNYAHMDTFIGKTASVDVFPYILEQLDRHA